jgi:hypothetical protein
MVALRIANLQQRLFLSQSKLRLFAEQYQTTLEQLDVAGLPDDASCEMHEDYIMWHHGATVAQQEAQDLQALQAIAQQGLCGEAITGVGH